jgi:V/A-type H+-transporting ATPase subunit B
MKTGIGEGHTREDHGRLSDQLYAVYAEGVDLRGLVAIVGKEALSKRDRMVLEFSDVFEDRFVRQSRDDDRSIFETLELGWDLLASLPTDTLTRMDRETLEKYHPKFREKDKKKARGVGKERRASGKSRASSNNRKKKRD